MEDRKILVWMADHYKVREISKVVLEDERFWVWSGSSKSYTHHYGKGMLAKHVREVAELCEENNKFFHRHGNGVDGKKLFLAALFHDVGKIWDYRPKNEEMTEWESAPHKNLIHHISRSSVIWNQAATQAGWSEEDKDEVTHCILSHHGMKEWGSPVEPKTRMAWILHISDHLSARMDDCDKRVNH